MKIIDLLEPLTNINVPFSIEGNQNFEIIGYSSIYHYRKNTVTWVRKINILKESDEGKEERFACIITPKDMPRIENAICQIWVENPKDAFFSILNHFWSEEIIPCISAQAVIEAGAVVGENTSVGPFTHISAQAIIGEGCRIGSNVTIKGRVRIGNECVIQSGAVLGEDGFAFIKGKNTQKFVKHYGGVTLEDHVSIGSQTCVCRGAIDDTVIKEYAKVDNLCHIAHNVIIGKRAVIVAGTVVMGSVHVGDDCWIATSMIRDQRHVGDHVVVGIGAVVVKDIPSDVTVVGNPAKQFERREKI